MRIQSWLTVILGVYWLVIFSGTHIPRVPAALDAGMSDKWQHYVAYAGLGWLLAAWRSSRGPMSRIVYLTLFGVVALYGVVDELLQIPVGRDCDILDWRSDVVGAASGLALFAAIQAFRNKRSAA